MSKTVPNTIDELRKHLRAGQLSALPQSAVAILELSKDANNGPAEYAAPIEADPGLAGQVLRFVNSSYFGFSREIASVKLAITLVGIRTLKNFALWSAVFSLMPNPQCGPFDLKCLWRDSLRRGLFARRLGQLLGMKDAEEPFMAALLQDMAIPVLAKEFPRDYAELLEGREEGKVHLSDLERRRYTWTHADAGAELADFWHLPGTLSDLVRKHTEAVAMMMAGNVPPDQLAVALSALLPASVDDAWHESERLEEYYNQVKPARAPELPDLLAEVDEQFKDFAALFKMSKAAKSLADWYSEAAAPVAE